MTTILSRIHRRHLCAAIAGVLLVAPPSWGYGQAPNKVACRATLDSLDARIRRSYAGFALEVVPFREREYRSTLARAQREATSAGLETSPCTSALRRYLGWFDDAHLFVFQDVRADTAGNRERERALLRDPRSEEALRADLERRGASRDPVEGIWRDGALRVAVVQQRPGSDTLIAIVLASDTSAWPVGGIRARLVRDGDGRYDATVATAGFGVQHLTATLHRRTLLRFSPGMWGREFPLDAADRDVAPLPNPRRPRVAIRPRSVVVSIPSHDGPYQREVDSLVATHRDALTATPLIIIDLRGNEGGGSLTTRALHPFIASRERRPTRYDEGTPMILSSPDLQAYVRRMGGTQPSPAVQRLLARMDEQPGRLVRAYDDDVPTAPSATPLDGPWRVAVLTDRGTVSAAEVTVLMALRSARAVTIGEPTAGALDYQSTTIVGLGTGDRRWALGFPTIAAHADLPARGMRGTGIAPQHPLRWANVTDPYAAVERIVLGDVPKP